MQLRRLTEQFVYDTGSSAERGVNLGLILAAGFGDVGSAAARTAYELCDRSYQFSSLNALGEAGCDAGDNGDFSLWLRGSQNDNAFAEFLPEVIDQRAELSALERIGAMGQHLYAFHFCGAADSLIESAGCGLHAGFFEFAAQAFQFVFL